MKKTAYYLFSLALILSPSSAWAGGGYGTPVKVSAYQTRDSISEIVLEALSSTSIEGKKCKRITLQVEYSRVPWYSFVPLMGSAHPSYAETQTALAYLQKSQQNKQSLLFLSMSGLATTANACRFVSKGLRLQTQAADNLISSYYYRL